MARYDRLKEKKRTADKVATVSDNNLVTLANEHARVADIYEHAAEIIDSIDAEFEKKTGLSGIDIAFLFVAVALQCVRQYVLTPFEERHDDQTEANKEKKGKKESSDRENQEYYASLEEINKNPVPFDANRQTEETAGVLQGGGKLGHRLTLGHDPILGWVFGTSNIATSTLTTWKFKTYHVKTQKGNTRWGERDFDYITQEADTIEMLKCAEKRFFGEGFLGYVTLVFCLHKEWKHLKSDINTTNSLPFPIVSTISPELANLLAEYGIDAANVGTVLEQAAMAEAINCLIATLHGMVCHYQTASALPKNYKELPYDEYEAFLYQSKQTLALSKVKTKKIILYSNAIASASNIIRVGVGIYLGDADAVRDLDIGGILNTIRHLFTDTHFIREVKKEFITKRWSEIVLGDELKFEEVN